MSLDESKYPTMKFMRCKQCGSVFAASLSGATECPDCASSDAVRYRPDGKETDDGPKEE